VVRARRERDDGDSVHLDLDVHRRGEELLADDEKHDVKGEGTREKGEVTKVLPRRADGHFGMTVSAPLYQRVMGHSWCQLAEALRSMHATSSTVRARGQFRIDYGSHPVARLLARLLRLPHPSAAADTRLVVSAHGDREQWERTFDGRRFVTLQYRWHDDLAERFGVLQFRFRLQVSDGSLLYVQRQAAVLCWRVRLPIPALCAPRVEAREDPAGPKRIRVQVRVVLPGIGLLISYAGIVDVEENGR
jgi:hypothetical protein